MRIQSPEHGRTLRKGLGILGAVLLTMSITSEKQNHSPPDRVYAMSVGEPVPIHLPPDCLQLTVTPVCETTTAEPTTTTTAPETTTTTTPPPPPTTEAQSLPTQDTEPPPQPDPPADMDSQHVQWMHDAGIDPSDYGYVDDIFQHESTWYPDNVSPNGCIGLGQNCPQGGDYWLKDACPNWQNDPVCQIGRFAQYAYERYGSWPAAAAYRDRHNSW